MQDNI